MDIVESDADRSNQFTVESLATETHQSRAMRRPRHRRFC